MSYRKKSQAALEFLTTYGWAFLVMIVTISALYYFGIFDFTKYLPQKCTFPQQFECIDFSMIDDAGGKEIRFQLLNNIGEKVYITEVWATNDAAVPLSCTPLVDLGEWDSGDDWDFVFTDCQDGAFVKGERVEAQINLSYYAVSTPSNPVHTIRGKIIGVVG
jgi:hypothetical protein